jgi:hypothetical protein
MLYSKNGSIPYDFTDGTEGWIEVPDMPIAPEGKEVVWWYPPGWVIRDLAPGEDYAWNQSTETWEKVIPVVQEIVVIVNTDQIVDLSSSQPYSLTSAQIGVL